MISTQQIQYILHLVESKNFSRAADACYVTQPTLSMQIKKAEDVLGFSIFDRDKNPLELTPWGKQLIPVLLEMNQINNNIIQLSKRANGTYIEELTIGIIPTISPYLIPMLYQNWKKVLTHSRLIIKENKTEELLELLENKKIDFAIIAGPVENTNWKVSPLFTEELLAYTRKKDASIIKLNELNTQRPWLMSQGNCLRSQMMQFCNIDQRSDDDWNFEGGNIELLLKMVDMNDGYTLVPKYYIPLLNKVKGAFHPIKDSKTNISPARSIIGIQSNRNTKHESIQKIIQSVQKEFENSSKKEFSIIKWK
jgi:LysR family hydrogen peroxide-inducible transcriptional activator